MLLDGLTGRGIIIRDMDVKVLLVVDRAMNLKGFVELAETMTLNVGMTLAFETEI